MKNLSEKIDDVHGQRVLADITGQTAALLAAIEIGLGSVIHGFKVPFGGHLLSLNQGFFLARAAIQAKRRKLSLFVPFIISNVVAVLKSLSPAGNKLGPMLSISVQGLLFNCGTLLFGINLLGIVVGMMFLSLWAFVQPIITVYLFIGNTLIYSLEETFRRLQKILAVEPSDLVLVLLAVVGIKLLLGLLVGLAASYLPDRLVDAYKTKLLAVSHRSHRDVIGDDVTVPSFRKRMIAALKDLTNPVFIISMLLTVLFLLFSQSSYSRAIWLLLRPLAIGFLFFYMARSPAWSRWGRSLEKSRFPTFGRAMRKATDILKTKKNLSEP